MTTVTTGRKKLGMAFKQSDGSWVTGYGWANTSVIKSDGYTLSGGQYSGYALVNGEMESVFLSGTMTISVNPDGKGFLHRASGQWKW